MLSMVAAITWCLAVPRFKFRRCKFVSRLYTISISNLLEAPSSVTYFIVAEAPLCPLTLSSVKFSRL